MVFWSLCHPKPVTSYFAGHTQAQLRSLEQKPDRDCHTPITQPRRRNSPVTTPAHTDTLPKLLEGYVHSQVLLMQDPHLCAILPFPVQQLVFGNALLRGGQPRQQDAGIRLCFCLEVSWLGRNWGPNTRLVPGGRCRERSCAALRSLRFSL